MAGGRPTKYEKKFNRQVEQLARLGATEQEIADFFGIDKATLTRWKNKYQEFCTSIKKGRLPADVRISESLYRRAQGFKYTETTFEKIGTQEELEDGSDEAVTKDLYKKKVQTKYMPADPASIFFWLKNRRGKVSPIDGQPWRDRQDIGLEFDQLTDEQVDKLFDRVLQGAVKQANNG